MASRAGSRTARFRPGYGRIAPNKIAILRTWVTGVLSLTVSDSRVHDEENEIQSDLASEVGYTYNLVIQIAGRKMPLIWNLTGMTHAELEATRQFFNHAFDLADPVVRERDKVAHDAFEAGDDSFSRIYRELPQLVVRQGPVRTDSEGVLDGPEGTTLGAGDGGTSSGRVRRDGGELADGEQVEGLSEDYEPTAD